MITRVRKNQEERFEDNVRFWVKEVEAARLRGISSSRILQLERQLEEFWLTQQDWDTEELQYMSDRKKRKQERRSAFFAM